MKRDWGGREERGRGEERQEPGTGREPAWYERDERELRWFEKPADWLSQPPGSLPGQSSEPFREEKTPSPPPAKPAAAPLPDLPEKEKTLSPPPAGVSRENPEAGQGEGTGFGGPLFDAGRGRAEKERDEAGLDEAMSGASPRGRSVRRKRAERRAADRREREGLDLNGLFAAEGGSGKKRRGEKEAGKIYLPSPPPALSADAISNPAAYIEKFFENTAAPAGGKRKNPLLPLGGMLVSLLCAALGVLTLLRTEAYPEGAFFTVVGAVMAGVFFVALVRSCKKKTRAGEFRLIKPYAVKSEFSPLHALAGGEVSWGSEKGQIFLFDGGLRLYYEEKGKKREAVTDKIYSERELCELVAAFRGGRLVVACEPAVKGREEPFP